MLCPDLLICPGRRRRTSAKNVSMQYRQPKQARELHDAPVRQELPEIAPHRCGARLIGSTEINEKNTERLGESVLVLRQ